MCSANSNASHIQTSQSTKIKKFKDRFVCISLSFLLWFCLASQFVQKNVNTRCLVAMHVICTIMLRLHCSLPKTTLIARWKSTVSAKLTLRCCALRHRQSTCICTTILPYLRLKNWATLPEVLLSPISISLTPALSNSDTKWGSLVRDLLLS